MVMWLGSTKWRKVLKFIKKNAHSGEGVKWLITMGVIVNKNIFQLSFPSFSSRKTPKFIFWLLKIQKSPPNIYQRRVRICIYYT